MKYPGRVIRKGTKDADLIGKLKEILNQVVVTGLDGSARLNPQDPDFGPQMERVVMLYQSRNVDLNGQPLKVDGEIGVLTWGALFGKASVPGRLDRSAVTPLLQETLRIAAQQIGVKEEPRNSNRGPMVDQYMRRVGLNPGHAWCCAFTYWCFDEAAKSRGLSNPMVKTAGCLDHWNKAPSADATRILGAQATDDPGLVRPGMLFIMDHGEGLGHTGFVEATEGGFMTTIEGNTDGTATREGGGVYRLTRKINAVNKGFISYG